MNLATLSFWDISLCITVVSICLVCMCRLLHNIQLIIIAYFYDYYSIWCVQFCATSCIYLVLIIIVVCVIMIIITIINAIIIIIIVIITFFYIINIFIIYIITTVIIINILMTITYNYYYFFTKLLLMQDVFMCQFGGMLGMVTVNYFIA